MHDSARAIIQDRLRRGLECSTRCMLNDLGLLSLADAEQSVLDFPYFRQVFLAPPWEEIDRQ